MRRHAPWGASAVARPRRARSPNRRGHYMMVCRMARWNYYFAACHAITTKGKTVELPGGHGMVTLDAVTRRDAAAMTEEEAPE